MVRSWVSGRRVGELRKMAGRRRVEALGEVMSLRDGMWDRGRCYGELDIGQQY